MVIIVFMNLNYKLHTTKEIEKKTEHARKTSKNKLIIFPYEN